MAKEKNCLSEFALVSASLDFKNPIDFQKRSDFQEKDFPKSDLFALIIAYNQADHVHFSGPECKKIGVHGVRFKEIAESARLLCGSLGEKFQKPEVKIQSLHEVLLKNYPDRLAYLANQGTNVYKDYTGLSLN